MTEGCPVVKHSDMSEDMQQDAIDSALKALRKYPIENEVASQIKREFDLKYAPTWHCFVGRNFGCFVTHQSETFTYFYIGQTAVMLFKMG